MKKTKNLFRLALPCLVFLGFVCACTPKMTGVMDGVTIDQNGYYHISINDTIEIRKKYVLILDGCND